MKKLFTVLPWIGLLLLAISLPLSFSSSYTAVNTGELGSGAGYAVTSIAGIIAVILVLIGWIVAKPRYLWLGALVAGILYIASFYGYYVEPKIDAWKIILALLPGILLVIEGGWLRLSEQKRTL